MKRVSEVKDADEASEETEFRDEVAIDELMRRGGEEREASEEREAAIAIGRTSVCEFDVRAEWGM